MGGKTETGEDSGLKDSVRTSHGAFIPKEYDDVLYGIEKRVEQYSQIPYENQEQLQLLRYHVGQEYKDHMVGQGGGGGRASREAKEAPPRGAQPSDADDVAQLFFLLLLSFLSCCCCASQR